MDTYLAADVGGTQLRVSLYPENGIESIIQKRIPTQGAGTAIERLLDLIESVWPKQGRVLAMAVALPGPIDPFAGILMSAPNIPGCENLPIRKILQDRFPTKVAVGNDANLAGLGEWGFGAGRGHHNLVYLTISTGIGGGVIADDRMLLGVRGLAAELGHVTVWPGGPLCSCGHRGHLESLGSGTGIANYFAEQTASGRITSIPLQPVPGAREISKAAEAGDPLAIETLGRAGTFVGIGLANYLHIFNPSIIILGGGVSRCGPSFYEPLHKALKSNLLRPEYAQDLILTQASLGDNAGLMGALALAQDTARQSLS
jgi:glucokinase